MGNGFEQSYNAQASVDEEHQVIVAVGVTNCAADSTQFIPMIEATEATAGELPQQVLADAGYRSETNFEQAESKSIDAVIALGREGADFTLEPSTVFGWIKGVLGFRQFSFRGLKKNNAEWHLVCLATNLRRMSRGMCQATA